MACGLEESPRARRISQLCSGASGDLAEAILLLREAKKFVSRCQSIGAIDLEQKINDFVSGHSRK